MTTEQLDSEFWEMHAFVRIRGRSRIDSEPQQILLDNSIFMGAIRSQDDIFEGHPAFQDANIPSRDALVALARRWMARASPSEIEDVVKRQLDRLSDEAIFAQIKSSIIDDLTAIYSQSSILSFFRTPLDQRNWAQYGESGTGHAFVFDFREPWVMSCIKGMLPIEAVPFPVQYVNEGEFPHIPIDLAPQDPEKAWRDLEIALLTKLNRWADQKEERLFRTGIPAGFVRFPPDSLRGVVLGSAAPSEDERLMLELSERRATPLPIFRLDIQRDTRQLVLRRSNG